MIRSFGNNEAQQIWNRKFVQKLPKTLQKQAFRRLRFLDAATSLGDLAALNSNHIEKMKGKWSGYFSMRVNTKYRIWFRWDGSNAHEVTFGDYHDNL